MQALIFDSVFNPFRGIIAYFRVFNGTLRKGDHVKFFNTGSEYDADEVGVLKLKMPPRDGDQGGRRGVHLLGHQDLGGREGRRYDHLGGAPQPQEAIAGFEDVKPMVFAGVYPWWPTSTRTCAPRSKSCNSTTPR